MLTNISSRSIKYIAWYLILCHNTLLCASRHSLRSACSLPHGSRAPARGGYVSLREINSANENHNIVASSFLLYPNQLICVVTTTLGFGEKFAFR